MMNHSSAQGQKKEQPPLVVTTVRGLFLLRGTTLTHWSRANGLSVQYVHLAVQWKRRGPKARRIVEMIRAELGL